MKETRRLAEMFSQYLGDLAYEKLAPTLAQNGLFYTTKSWTLVRNFRLYAGVLNLARHGPIMFQVDLPSMPHDFGLPLTKIVVYFDKVVMLIKEPPHMRRRTKKKNRAYEALKNHPDLYHMGNFGVPIKVQFEKEWWDGRNQK